MTTTNQLQMNFDGNTLVFSASPIVPKNIESEIENDDDYLCLFCGDERTSSRRCCSSVCSKHLNDYTNSSIPNVLVKTLLRLSIEDRIKRIKTLSERENVSFQSLIKHFILNSKKLGATQSDILFTPKIAEYIELSGTVPSFLLPRESAQ